MIFVRKCNVNVILPIVYIHVYIHVYVYNTYTHVCTYMYTYICMFKPHQISEWETNNPHHNSNSKTDLISSIFLLTFSFWLLLSQLLNREFKHSFPWLGTNAVDNNIRTRIEDHWTSYSIWNASRKMAFMALSWRKSACIFSRRNTCKALAGATALVEPTAQAGDLPSAGETLAKALAGATAVAEPTAQAGDLPSMILDIPSASFVETRSYACSDAGFLWLETVQILLSSTPVASNLVMEVALKQWFVYFLTPSCSQMDGNIKPSWLCDRGLFMYQRDEASSPPLPSFARWKRRLHLGFRNEIYLRITSTWSGSVIRPIDEKAVPLVPPWWFFDAKSLEKVMNARPSRSCQTRSVLVSWHWISRPLRQKWRVTMNHTRLQVQKITQRTINKTIKHLTKMYPPCVPAFPKKTHLVNLTGSGVVLTSSK